MIICPYKEMKNLESLPCTREERGGWVYCSFCGQKMRRELLFEPVDSLIGFCAIALIFLVLANSLGNSSRTPEPAKTSDRTPALTSD
jgi:hypothetical protein